MVTEFVGELVRAWSCWAPSMSPDGRRVAFISDRTGRPALWVQEIPEPGQGNLAGTLIGLSEDPVLAVHWSADGEWLAAVLATGGGVRTQVWVVRPDGGDARRIAGSPDEHALLGPWTRHGHRLVVVRPATSSDVECRCDIVDAATGGREPLARGGLVDVLDLSDQERFALLRDGTRGAQFVRMLDRRADRDYPLLPYPAIGSTDAGILRPPPAGSAPSTTLVAYLVTDAGQSRPVLLAVPIGADGRRGEGGVIAAREDADVEFADADDAGRLLVLSWNVDGRSEVELLDLGTRRRREVPDLPGEVVTHCVMSRAGDQVLLCVEAPDRPRRLWRLDTASLAWRPVTDDGLATARTLVRPKLERFVSHDGLPMSGWLYRPPGIDGPVPMLISLHGGPESQERPAFSPQHQAVVAAGVAVFAPNVRGSSGSGRAFVHADDRYGRYDAIADVAACVAMLVERGYADPERIAIGGRSYGGYLTLAALVWFPQLFAAGIDVCGMSHLMTFYRDTEPWIAARSVTKYGDPDRDADLLTALSPLTRAEAVTAPLLVVHGELDTNVPIGEAHQIVAALRDLGRPVEYLELAGEGHEYRRTETRELLINRIVRFLLPIRNCVQIPSPEPRDLHTVTAQPVAGGARFPLGPAGFWHARGMDAQTTLGQLNLVVRDLDATVTFYRRLGWTVTTTPDGVHAEAAPADGVSVEFDTAESVGRWDTGYRGATGGSTVLGLHTGRREDVDEIYADLTAHGYRGRQPPYDAFWGSRYAIVDDPDGNPVGLMSPSDDERRSWPPTPPPRATE
jgi:dipeptidyl aminopeptidase/acylaminoacyl peptidase/predicted enzyme related to lactoylglutathione lyase